MSNDPQMHWKVHLPNLVDEIMRNPGTNILRIPLQITKSLLAAVAERAADLNDPILNDLMCRLTLYSVADPQDNASYDPKVVDEVTRLAESARALRRPPIRQPDQGPPAQA